MQLAWITSAGGLIGNCLVQTAAALGAAWCVRGLTRAQFDLTDDAAVRRAFRADAPALVIHCAALSRSPACESHPALARLLNLEVTARIQALLSFPLPGLSEWLAAHPNEIF